VARSKSAWGPFEPFAGNPILTHRDRRSEPIQATGHADLVETEAGAHFLVLLGIRPPDGKHHHLGRETFLAPLSFGDDGWPRVNGGQPIRLEMAAEGLPPSQPFPPPPQRDDFDAPRLGPEWIHVRNPDPADHSLSERPGFLRLRGNRATLDDVAAPAFAGRRQRALHASVAARIEFSPQGEEEAGLTVRANEENHYDLVLAASEGRRVVRLRTRVKGVTTVVGEAQAGDGRLVLFVEATPDAYELGFHPDSGKRRVLGSAKTAPLSSELAGGFTGAVFGLFATSRTETRGTPADFDWFELTSR
jgi:alpha-N-arabinofuranosidase